MNSFCNKKYLSYLSYAYLLLIAILSSYLLYHEEEKLVTILLLSIFTFISYVVVLHISKIVFRILIILTSIVVFISYPTIETYGPIDPNIISSLVYTNTTEAISYLKILNPITIFKTFLVVFLIMGSLVFKYKKMDSRLILLFSSLFIYPFVKLCVYGVSWITITNTNYLSYGRILTKSMVYYTSIISDNKNIEIIENSIKSNSWKIDAFENKKDFYVVILGESARRDLMHSYGFTLANTPFMSNTPGIQFDNTVSVSPSTNYSTRRIFFENQDTSDIIYSNNIISLAKNVGFKTTWISNQNENSKAKNPINTLEKLADVYKATGDKIGNDFQILPLFQKTLQMKSDSPQLIIVHLFGSHPTSCDRTYGKYSQYYLSTDASCYVESIKNTDLLLQKLIENLDKVGKPYSAIYLSDHGVSLNNDQYFIHSDQYKGSYNIPLFVWDNEVKDRIHIKAQRNNKDFLILLKEIIGIKTKKEFLSEDSMPLTDEVINMRQEKTLYSKLKLDSIIP